MFSLSISDRIEAPHPHNLANGVATAVISVRIGAQDATKVCLEPEFVSGFTLLASLIDTECLDGTWNRDVNAHIETGEGIVAAVYPFRNL